jgi:hypothetical protein
VSFKGYEKVGSTLEKRLETRFYVFSKKNKLDLDETYGKILDML